MGNWAIVAIPEKDDRVWKLSSEKVPHMTLLSLGEHEEGPETAHILSYIEHAANTMLHKFYMSVEKRDTLGPNDADVLLFEKGWLGTEIIKFRAALLKEPLIKEWFDASDQYPDWLPHLTMGFPATPAKEDDREYGISGIHFDKIALWTGDYDGPEVDLSGYHDVYEDSPALMQAMPMIDHELAIVGSYRELTLDHFEHAGQTIQDVLDSMDPEDRDVFDLIVGAAVDGEDLSDVDGLIDFYDSLSEIEQAVMSFVIGNALADGDTLEQSDMDGNHLSQSGVKGMKWGVRKDKKGAGIGSTTNAREVARNAVKGGGATLGEAHVAAIKSTGHRVTNAVLGDKTHWKRAAAIAGLTAAGVGASFAVPALLPASALTSVAHLSGLTFVGGHTVVQTGAVSAGGIHVLSATTVGSAMITGAATTASTITGAAAAVGNYASNAVRAVRGNSRVNASFAKLGNAAAARQTQGTKAIQKTLVNNGGIRKKDLRQSMDLGKSVSAIEKPLSVDVLHSVGAYLAQYEMELYPLTASLEVSEEDALQYGKRGMKWGVRHIRGLNGRVSSKEIPADAKEAIVLKSKVKKNKGTHVLSNEELEKLNKRINLENAYTKASKEQSIATKGHSKVKTLLDLGKTANAAIAFANSDAGRLLSGKMRDDKVGKHAKGVPIAVKQITQAVTGGKHSK